jgi:hypothetical protein
LAVFCEIENLSTQWFGTFTSKHGRWIPLAEVGLGDWIGDGVAVEAQKVKVLTCFDSLD